MTIDSPHKKNPIHKVTIDVYTNDPIAKPQKYLYRKILNNAISKIYIMQIFAYKLMQLKQIMTGIAILFIN